MKFTFHGYKIERMKLHLGSTLQGKVTNMTMTQPVVKVDVAVGGGVFVLFANGKRVLYSEEFLKSLKVN